MQLFARKLRRSLRR
jgi:hypothetical protein